MCKPYCKLQPGLPYKWWFLYIVGICCQYGKAMMPVLNFKQIILSCKLLPYTLKKKIKA